MLPLAQPGLTVPAVAGRGLNELLGITAGDCGNVVGDDLLGAKATKPELALIVLHDDDTGDEPELAPHATDSAMSDAHACVATVHRSVHCIRPKLDADVGQLDRAANPQPAELTFYKLAAGCCATGDRRGDLTGRKERVCELGDAKWFHEEKVGIFLRRPRNAAHVIKAGRARCAVSLCDA